jgi:hypothetical protein
MPYFIFMSLIFLLILSDFWFSSISSYVSGKVVTIDF